MRNYFFTSESVTEGHPDKLCDNIADSILDEYLKRDKFSRVAIEVMAAKNNIYISGQVNSSVSISNNDIEKITRDIIKEIGYDNENLDLDYRTCKIQINIMEQSKDISNILENNGAGDQGIIFGFASNETLEYMPMPIVIANELAALLTKVRKEEIIKGLRPDGKTQVTVEYKNHIPFRIEYIVISVQHRKEKDLDLLRKEVYDQVIMQSKYSNLIDKNTKIQINKNGQFIIGGPLGDTGLTGRKIIVDTYGGVSKHRRGSFFG